MLQYYKQMFAESSPLTGLFGCRRPDRIHFRGDKEAAPKWAGGTGGGHCLKDARCRVPAPTSTPGAATTHSAAGRRKDEATTPRPGHHTRTRDRGKAPHADEETKRRSDD